MTKKRLLLASLIAATCCTVPLATSRSANADESASRFYEDDAWYDVSEWFDGNDYNPTDEAIGRWDNETFEYADNRSSTDRDNDRVDTRQANNDDYGFSDRSGDDERWFYDYYDDGSGVWSQSDGWSSYAVYDDSDDDGIYDRYVYYRDTNNDGIYDSFISYSFDASDDQDSQAKSSGNHEPKAMNAKLEETSGTIEQIKQVDVRGKDHTVVQLKDRNGKSLAVDLGRTQNTTELSKGDSLTVSGHRVKVGDKPILIATQAQSKAAELAIDRSGREYTGEVASTREVTVQGQQHLMAKIMTANDKKLLVDLGPKKQVSDLLDKGQSITVKGIPVQVKDRVVLMAQSIELGDNHAEIKRVATKPKN
ncbi:hypothetical protein Pla52o_14110 [Novipirellula galeiformis]|uniref:Uncharacterized protein n=1 Tax=Novipirellula galeiformis TaxID=2528004 RepID=A0A5C6CJS8_9BACT|nr:hypothetical protein [Novipirellula galeiformis]TWU25113.1 hypothetical protein Pla52o_14110 [Novipirellula galeiformis]